VVPQVISESDVRAARRAGFLSVPEGALVTQLAREAASSLGVELGLKPRAPRAVHVLGNWKMNLGVEEAVALVERLASRAELSESGARVAVLPPHPYLMLAASLLAGSSVEVGAQDVSPEEAGAFTGDVSVRMIRGFCSYLLVGHSERRRHHGESSELVWRKAALGLGSGLKVVTCVGETAQERDRGRMLAVLREQLAGVAKAVSEEAAERLIVAYEPVWAIGTNRRATREQVEEAHREIRRLLAAALGPPGDSVPILYGGSVQPQNAAELADSVAVDGFLVGAASLDDAAFAGIAATFREKLS
jgi:triosephosphate isomerase (TIM)